MTTERFVLGIETSTPVSSVCLLGDAGGIVESSFRVPDGPSGHLLPVLDRMVADLGIERSRIVAVGAGIGPGSFTGLRVGLATAKGLAVGLDLPTWGFPSLEVLAANCPVHDGLILPILDARKGQVFAALYRAEGGDASLVWGPVAATAEELPDLPNGGRAMILGSGIGVYRERLASRFGGRGDFLPETTWWPRGAVVARMAAAAFAAAGEPAGFTDRLDPVYGRRSEAELGYDRRMADGGRGGADDAPHDR
jgi:tRNA threonylcarbamoyladenosine biosynthesis protein TsaB